MSSITNKVLKVEADSRNLNAEDLTNLLGFARKVGEIESNNIPDRLQGDDPNLAGRGKYQFENDKGSNAAKTAATRLKQWESKNEPLPIPKKDREELSKPSPDFSKLSEDTQDALFFINLSIHPTAPFTDIAKGKISNKDAWLNYHWAGADADKESKSSMWDNRFSNSSLAKAAKTAKTFPEALM
jgi:Rad3-related DNA helicase